MFLENAFEQSGCNLSSDTFSSCGTGQMKTQDVTQVESTGFLKLRTRIVITKTQHEVCTETNSTLIYTPRDGSTKITAYQGHKLRRIIFFSSLFSLREVGCFCASVGWNDSATGNSFSNSVGYCAKGVSNPTPDSHDIHVLILQFPRG